MEDTQQGNCLIAEFMGATNKSRYGDYPEGAFRFPTTLHDSQVPDEASGHEVPYIHLKDLQYNTSWDWLMPVIEKINTIALDEHGEMNVMFAAHECLIGEEYNNPKVEVKRDFKKPLIEMLWLAVVEFIKWKNNQK